jgi:predicted dehydrogenase
MTKLTRRAVLAAAPMFVPRHAFGANDRVRVGVIGTGNRSGLLIDQLPETAEVISVADCYLKRCQDAAAKRQAKWRIHSDYRALLEDKEIDGVIVGTTDHARVLACIHACQAGKDIYAEKPLTLYIEEGRQLVKAARRYNRIVQVGSQQRSMAMNRIACDFVRNGGLGKLHFVQAVNYSSSALWPGLPPEPVPDTLNWDVWQGQAVDRPYHSKLHTGWMAWWDYSGGEMTNWGAHGLDQIQWALGMSESGPVELWPLADGPKGALAFRYDNGVTVRLEMPQGGELMGGGIFVGEKGRVEVIRNGFRTDPPKLIPDLPPQEEVEKWNRAQWQAKYHMQNWLDCLKTRQTPLADVEVGHRSISVSHLANITRRLNRRLRWDPAAEKFIGDDEANGHVRRARRKGYELPSIA